MIIGIGLTVLMLIIIIIVFATRHHNKSVVAEQAYADEQAYPHHSIEQKLEEWILKKEASGYTDQQLKQFLLNKGYNPKDVDEAVKKTTMRTNFITQNSPPQKISPENTLSQKTPTILDRANPTMEPKLEDWILKKEALGYNREQLRQVLLNRGYNSKDVDDAVKKAGKK
jgi:SOS response regulatory protein OraA/RecX